MQSLRQVGIGVLLGVVSIIIVLGGFSLALVEGGGATTPNQPAFPSPTNTAPVIILTIFPTQPLLITDTPQASQPGDTATATTAVITVEASATATLLATLPAGLTICPPPAGWLPIIVQPNDTLASLAQAYRTSAAVLRTNNCLLNDTLITNSILYVPPQATSTFIPCGAPSNWGRYTVVAGDTLYHISLQYRVSVQDLMRANCLNTTYIKAGQVLRVPNVATSTGPVVVNPLPTVTSPPEATLTSTSPAPSATATEPAPTEAPSPTPSATATLTPETLTGP